MSTRSIAIPPFVRPGDGGGTLVRVRTTLVGQSSRQPVPGYADGHGWVGEASITTTDAEQLWPLIPNAEISPPTFYRVWLEHAGIPASAPVDCTVTAGETPLPLWQLLEVAAPSDPADFWGALLLTADERAALSAASTPSAANPLATLADLPDGDAAEALEPILAGHALRVPLSGRAALADAATVGRADVVALAAIGADTGLPVRLARTRLELPDWTGITGAAELAAGAVYYLSPAAPGALTATAPDTTGHYLTRVGLALSATTLAIQPEPPIRL